MKLIKLFSYFMYAVMAVGLLQSCVKKDATYDVNAGGESARKQEVYIVGAGDIQTIARNVSPTLDTFQVIDLRRSPNDNAQLNQPLSVKLALKASLIDDYNTANGTGFVALPSSAYTILGDINNMTFQPGQDILEVKIKLDKSQLDLSQQYALGFSISDAGSGAAVPASKDALYSIGVKNKYDGHYTVTGTMVDYSNAGLTGPYPWDVYLITSGANQVLLYDNEYTFDIYHKIISGGSSSYYGAFGVVINFDPSGNGTVTSVVNLYGQPASNTRSATLDPSGINKWDPVSGNMDIKYWMDQPSVIAGHRTSFTEHYKYLGPR
jgi:hypothetical protein